MPLWEERINNCWEDVGVASVVTGETSTSCSETNFISDKYLEGFTQYRITCVDGIKPAVGDTAEREIKWGMIHIRLFNYHIQLERFTRWEKFKYNTRYYKDDLWEFSLDFAYWRLYIHK